MENVSVAIPRFTLRASCDKSDCCVIDASDQTWWPTAGQLLTTTQSSGAKIRHEADYELPSCCQVSSLNERAAKTMGRKYPSSFIKYPFYVYFAVLLTYLICNFN